MRQKTPPPTQDDNSIVFAHSGQSIHGKLLNDNCVVHIKFASDKIDKVYRVNFITLWIFYEIDIYGR